MCLAMPRTLFNYTKVLYLRSVCTDERILLHSTAFVMEFIAKNRKSQESHELLPEELTVLELSNAARDCVEIPTK